MLSPSKYYHQDIKEFLKDKRGPRYIILNHTLSTTPDVQKLARGLYSKCTPNTRVLVISFNFLWKPLLNLASLLGLRKRDSFEPNWVTKDDIENMFSLEGFEEIKNGGRFLFPFDIGIVSTLINRFIARLPIINDLCLTSYQIFRKGSARKEYSVSVIIPARNEEGNMIGILKKIPRMGKKVEVIFVEGWSTDNTYSAIENEIKVNTPRWMKTSLYKQKGKGKKNAVETGFSKAKNEMLMILDADLTVRPNELTKFYNVIARNQAELVIGSRLVYPMEKQAMRLLNYFGNKLFSIIFSFIIGQKIKDTLCGTKVLLRKNYELIKANQKYFGNFDPFGDFDLIFGAAKLNFKIAEIPIRYRDRTYGTTNISRFRHGLLLAKMAIVGALKIKFS